MKKLITLLSILFCTTSLAATSPMIWGSPYPLILDGGLRFNESDTSTTCNAAAAGSIRYNAGTMEACNGTTWSSLGGGGGGASTSLNNLASTAVNADIIPGADNTLSLGSSAFNWNTLNAKQMRSSTTFSIRSTGGAGIGSLASTIGTSGAVNVSSGAITVTAAASGAMTFQSGAVSTTTGASGGATILTGTTVNSNSGNASIFTGDPSGSGNSGSINLTTGEPQGAGNSGAVNLTTADPQGAGTSGGISLATGNPASAASGTINFSTGASSVASGSINLLTGTGSPRGKIIFNDGTAGTTGHVWTSSATDGTGGWAAASPLTTKGDIYTFSTLNARLPVGTNGQYLTASSGAATGLLWATLPSFANQSLSNLTSPTAINQDLIFNKTNPTIRTPDQAAANSDNLHMLTGAALTTFTSGNIDFISGTTVDGNSGQINSATGSGAGNGESGLISSITGNTSGTGNTGAIVASTGNAGGSGAQSGNLDFFTGSSVDNTSGGFSAHTGDTTDANSGNAQLYTGSPTSTGDSGNVTIYSGENFGNGLSGIIDIHTGNSSAESGLVQLSTGDASGSDPSGSVNVNSGSNTGTGASGNFDFGTGTAVSGASGDVTIGSGNSSAGNSGNIIFNSGTAGGVRGKLSINVPNIDIDATITAGGTTGAQTIHKSSGTVNFAATDTTLVVTNSFVTASSIVLATARTNDTTCWVKDVESGAGSFTIRMVAACTAETSVGFFVIN